MSGTNLAVDFIGQKGQVQGEVASFMSASGRMEPGALRPYVGADGRSFITKYLGGDQTDPKNYMAMPIQTNGTLRRDEWKRLDEAIMPIAEAPLGGIQDLVSAGLTYDLGGNGMATTVLEWHDVDDSMSAEVTMDGITRGDNDRPNFGTNYLPLPIIHADYQLNARELAVSRNMGNPLDTTLAERAARRVREKLEDMLFTNTTYAFGGGTIYSYLNHPDRNTQTLSTAWDSDSAAGILGDVLGMKQSSINARHFGPWVLYIPTAYNIVLDEDYDTSGTSTQTIRDRILKIDGINDIKISDRLPANNVVLVEMKSETVRLVRGMGIQNVEWQTEGKMVTKFKVMTIQVPQIRADQSGQSGIVHGSV